ncbi:hypothetical protein [Streptomyces sp. NPDC002520]
MHTGRLLIATIATGLGDTTSVLLHAPWWLSVMAFVRLTLGLVVVAIQSLIPQESAHRLAWWRDRRRHQQVRRQTRRRAGDETGGGAGPNGPHA